MATKSRNLLSETKGLSCYAPRADVSECMARVDLVENMTWFISGVIVKILRQSGISSRRLYHSMSLTASHNLPYQHVR